MIQKDKIDTLINQMLDFLPSIQNEDGSFDTMYLQPYYNPQKGWMHYAGNSPYETAFPLLILQKINNPKATDIIKNGIKFLKKNSLNSFLWTYAYPSKKALVPYDTDSTSLSSLVLENTGFKMDNKSFLNGLILENNYYPFYIWSTNKTKDISFLKYLRLKWRNYQTRNSLNIINKGLELSDSEFTSSCINLRYLGRNYKNERVWKSIVEKVNKDEVDFIYYLNKINAIYHFSHLVKYFKFGEIDEEKLNSQLEYLRIHFNQDESNSQQEVLFANSILLMDRIELLDNQLVELIFNNMNKENFKMNSAFYTSNINTDYQPDTKLPHTYFGSPAITCSLYLEFLNLYRKRFIGTNTRKID